MRDRAHLEDKSISLQPTISKIESVKTYQLIIENGYVSHPSMIVGCRTTIRSPFTQQAISHQYYLALNGRTDNRTSCLLVLFDQRRPTMCKSKELAATVFLN